MWSDLTLDPPPPPHPTPLQGQMRIPKLKSAYTPLLLVLEVCNVKTNL